MLQVPVKRTVSVLVLPSQSCGNYGKMRSLGKDLPTVLPVNGLDPGTLKRRLSDDRYRGCIVGKTALPDLSGRQRWLAFCAQTDTAMSHSPYSIAGCRFLKQGGAKMRFCAA